MLTATLRQQHAEVVAAIAAIEQALAAGRAGCELRPLVAALGAKLTLHLAAEDRMVYPQLQASQEPAVSAMARRFAEEMGGLADAFAAFARRYGGDAAIDADRAGFAAAFHALVAAVLARVRAEETELYPAVDRTAQP